jgi:PAS domain S-box-containing protein
MLRVGDAVNETRPASTGRQIDRLGRSRQPIVWVLAFVGFVFVCATLWGVLVWRDQETTLRDAGSRAAWAARVLDEHAEQMIEAGDRTLTAILETVRGWDKNDAAAGRDIWLHAHELVAIDPRITSAWVLDANGDVVLHTDRHTPEPGNMASRRHFRSHLQPESDLYLGGRGGGVPGKNGFVLSRALRDRPDGLLAVVGLELESEPFSAIFSGSGPGGNYLYALYTHEGELLAGSSGIGDHGAEEFDPLVARVRQAAVSEGSFRAALAGDPAVVGYSVAFPPVMAVVTMPTATVLDEWRIRSWQSAVVVLVAIAAFTALTVLGLRSARRERASLAALDEANRHLEQRVNERTSSLRRLAERLSEAQEIAGLGWWEFDFRTRTLTWSDQMFLLFGLRPGAPVPSFEELRTLVHPDDLAAFDAQFESRSAVSGKVEVERRWRRPDGTYRWVHSFVRPYTDETGAFAGLVGTVLDISERKRAEQRQALIVSELDHRVRNLLAAIRSILRLARNSAATKEEYAAAVDGRIEAMSRAHGLLASSGWHGAALRRIVCDELEPYVGADRPLDIEGPDLLLRPSAAVSIALVIHELATNAAKYGALSVARGRISVSWRLEGEAAQSLVLTWKESGGPPVTAPSREGFGTLMLKRALEHEFTAAASLDYEPDGFRFSATIPLGNVEADVPATEPEERAEAHVAAEENNSVEGARVLVVEDDMLIAQDICEHVRGAGGVVVGPVARLADAVIAAAEGEVDVAVLDVNLAGASVFAVADVLKAKGVPFVFLTGYRRRDIPQRFGDAPSHLKPVRPEAVLRTLGRQLAAAAAGHGADIAAAARHA